nr:unnamed protein product [Callosobruchus analis]
MNAEKIPGILKMLQTAADSSSEEEESALTVLFSSTESDSDDDEMLVLEIETQRRGPLMKRPRIEHFVERTVPGYSSEEFKSHFRMYPKTFEFVLSLVGPLLSTAGANSRPQTPAKTQLLLALWLMATPDSYRSACTKFNVGKATCVRSLRRVCRALHGLAPKFITWPEGQRATDVMVKFEQASGFPKVMGTIDGTHIEITKPRDDAHNSFCNRKGYSSIQVQSVCTSNLLFTSVYAGHAGSIHDARVFSLSRIPQLMQNSTRYFSNDSHLVGDPAYPIHPCLMTPYKDNGHLTARQKNYNFCLSSARTAIERAFEVWKSRWRRILDRLPMITIEKIPEYLLAISILYNICILRDDFVAITESTNHNVYLPMANPQADILNDAERRAAGSAKRDRIMNELAMRYV